MSFKLFDINFNRWHFKIFSLYRAKHFEHEISKNVYTCYIIHYIVSCILIFNLNPNREKMNISVCDAIFAILVLGTLTIGLVLTTHLYNSGHLCREWNLVYNCTCNFLEYYDKNEHNLHYHNCIRLCLKCVHVDSLNYEYMNWLTKFL